VAQDPLPRALNITERSEHFRKRMLTTVQRVLKTMPEAERVPFLTHVEEKVRVEGDLAGLRIINDYLRKLRERHGEARRSN